MAEHTSFHISAFKKDKFETFIANSGAEILITTNPYEVFRFRANNITSIIYKNKNGYLTFVGQAFDAFQAFQCGKNFKVSNKTKRRKLSTDIRTIFRRDGPECFYCGKILIEGHSPITIEHLLSLSHGGSNHIANKVLACQTCNEKAANLDLIAKIKLRDALHAQRNKTLHPSV